MSRLHSIAALMVFSALLPACTAPAPKPRTALPQFTIKPISEIRPSADGNIDYYALGNHYEESGRVGLAMEAYIKVEASDRKYLAARNAMAKVYSKQGRLTEAEGMLREVIAQSPSAAYLQNNLGYIYFLQGNYTAARRALHSALSLDPDYEWARNNLKLVTHADQRFIAENVLPSETPVTTIPAFEVWAAVKGTNAELKDSLSAAKAQPQSDSAASTISRAYGKALVEVSNGNGTTGLAKRLSLILLRQGLQVGRITNQPPYRQVLTEIQYREGFEQEAEDLKNALRGYAMIVPTSGQARYRTNVRVVLGSDISSRMAEIDIGKPNVFALNKSSIQ